MPSMEKPPVELYSGTSRHFFEALYSEIRKETYGKDIGQNSWLTADECRRFIELLQLSADKKVAEIALGSGGPALFMAKQSGCILIRNR